jgi:heat shock protein HslJ
MRRIWFLLLLLALLPPLALAPARRAQGASSPMAPADAYFGRLRMSYIGINNTFRDTAIQAGDFTTEGGIVNRVNFAMDALSAWENQYPRDPQLARSYFLGQTTLKKIWLKPYQLQAWVYMQHIMKAFPGTFFAKTVRADIAKGFTMNWFAAPPLCSDPNPPPVPSPTNAGSYKIVVHAQPCVPATPSPSPSPTPTAAPTAPASPTMSPFGVGVPPPGMSPIPHPSASGTPNPAASGTPHPAASGTPHPAASASPARVASGAAQPAFAASLGGMTWTLTELGGQPVPVASGAPAASLRFDVAQKRVSGSTGCNNLSGTYTANEAALHFAPLATTRMACLDPTRQARETAFLAALERVTGYRIDGPTLTLYAAEAPLTVFHGAAPQE